MKTDTKTKSSLEEAESYILSQSDVSSSSWAQ